MISTSVPAAVPAAPLEFPGFEAEDFAVFAIPDFTGRMAAIRARVRPRLLALGQELHGPLSELVGQPVFPHAAQHMRRRVNPPPETWAAFCRDRKGYKRWTHFRVAISADGVRVTVFVEDDADDKAQFGANIQAAAGPLLEALGTDAPALWYTLGSESPLPHARVTPGTLEAAGAALQRLKTLKFQAGIPLPAADAAGMSGMAFERWALAQAERLRPLYLAGTVPGYRP